MLQILSKRERRAPTWHVYKVVHKMWTTYSNAWFPGSMSCKNLTLPPRFTNIRGLKPTGPTSSLQHQNRPTCGVGNLEQMLVVLNKKMGDSTIFCLWFWGTWLWTSRTSIYFDLFLIKKLDVFCPAGMKHQEIVISRTGLGVSFLKQTPSQLSRI